MEITRGTTPTISVPMPENVEGSVIKTTIQSGGKKISVPQDRLTITEDSITFTLTESETLKMSTNAVIKIKAKKDEQIITSDRQYYRVIGDVLNKEVV